MEFGSTKQVSKGSIGITTQNSWIQLKWWRPKHFDDRGRSNSGFQTTDHWNLCTSEAAISPSDLLTMKSKVVMPPPGSFGTVDLYSKRRWRGIQHITNEFWSWWRKKFLTSLQIQSKWSKSRRKLTVSDIVLLKTEVDDRNHWPMARVISCEMDKNGMVWAVRLRVGKSKYCKGQLIKLYYYWKMK